MHDRKTGWSTSLLAAATALTVLAAGCGPANTADSERSSAADKWLKRAQEAFQVADVDEARDAIQRALAIAPTDSEVKLLAGRIALARLDYDESLRQLKDVPGSEAAGLRGRALWYKGELDASADELEKMLEDPDVKDEWAKSIAKLARRGAGRTPFTISGGLLAPVEMPHVSPLAPFFVVPLEIDGESALALISTGNAEVVLDSTTRKEPSWVSLRFAKRLEVHDVPALTQDLSGVSKSLGAPIKALLGVNLLRHLNATVDYGGRQFVARTFTPPAPPNATRIDLAYIRGGGMVLQSSIGADKGLRAALLVDTAMQFPLALDQAGWKKAGVEASALKLVAEDPEQKLREGVVPMLRIGSYDVPRVPGVYGAGIAEIEKVLTLDIDGVIGAGLLSHFRITFGEGGRLMWIEDDTAVQRLLGMSPGGARPGQPPGPGAAPVSPGGEVGPGSAPPPPPVNEAQPKGPAGPAGPAPAAPPSTKPDAPAPGKPGAGPKSGANQPPSAKEPAR